MRSTLVGARGLAGTPYRAMGRNEGRDGWSARGLVDNDDAGAKADGESLSDVPKVGASGLSGQVMDCTPRFGD